MLPTFSLNNGPHGTREVFDYLRTCAAGMYTDNYAHICDEVARISKGAVKMAPIGIGDKLGHIRSECIRCNIPWINALAVNLGTGRPSDGFLPQDTSWNPSHETLWRGMVLQVFSYDWNHITVR